VLWTVGVPVKLYRTVDSGWFCVRLYRTVDKCCSLCCCTVLWTVGGSV